MRAILEFLDKALASDIISGKCNQTYIIMGVEKLKPFRTHIVKARIENGVRKYETVEKDWPPYIQQELESSLANKSISYHMGGYEGARRQANRLYASYSRSLSNLLKHGLIKSNYVSVPERKPVRANRAYYWTTRKGRAFLRTGNLWNI